MSQGSPDLASYGVRSHAWMLLVASALATCVGLSVTGVSIASGALTGLALWTGASGALTLFQHRIEAVWFNRLIDWFEALALFCSISLLGCLASYAVAAAGNSYADDWLAGLDRALGFDWRIAYRVVEQSPFLQIVGRVAYASIFVSPLTILSVLCARGLGEQARRFVFVYGLALWFTMAVFAIVPARGPIDYFNLGHASYTPATSLDQAAAIAALRAGWSTNLNLSHLHGLVSFPSFHAASAVLFVWAARPVRRLFWPMVAVNAAMLCATPVEGNHYLVDLIGGGAVAWASIIVSRAIARLALPRRGSLEISQLGKFAPSLRPARASIGSSAGQAPAEIAATATAESLAA